MRGITSRSPRGNCWSSRHTRWSVQPRNLDWHLSCSDVRLHTGLRDDLATTFVLKYSLRRLKSSEVSRNSTRGRSVRKAGQNKDSQRYWGRGLTHSATCLVVKKLAFCNMAYACRLWSLHFLVITCSWMKRIPIEPGLWSGRSGSAALAVSFLWRQWP